MGTISSDGAKEKLTYSQSGLSGITRATTGYAQVVNESTETKIQKVDTLIKALGTMVVKPEYTSDPTTIGKKTFTGSIQQPILQDTNRDIAEAKLIELIKQL